MKDLNKIYKDKTAIFVLGMHRSGTSALTRCLNILGATLPERLMQSAPANPFGHFEPIEIVNIHDRLLAAAGSAWSDWSAFPSEWHKSNTGELFVEELMGAIRDDYKNSPLFAMKDPRILRFIPLWREVMSRLDIQMVSILPYRNPIEVALSLKKRDGFPVEHGFLLWMRHVLDAERESRSTSRVFLSYEALLAQKQTTIYRMIEALPVIWPYRDAKAFDEISSFLDTKLRRHTASIIDLSLHKEVPEEIRVIYKCYESLSVDPQDANAMEQLDSLSSEFNRTSGLISTTFQRLRERFETNNSQVNVAIDRSAQQEQNTAALEQVLTARLDQQNERIALLDRKLADSLAHQEQHIMAFESELTTSRNQQDQCQASFDQKLSDEMDHHVRRIEALEHTLTMRLDQQDQRLASLDQKYSDTMIRKEQHIAVMETALIKIQAAYEAVEVELAGLRSASATQQEVISNLHTSLARVAGEYQLNQRSPKNTSPLQLWRSRAKRPWGPIHELVLKSGLSDPEWYADNYELDAASDPLDHFVKIGSSEGYSPGPLFDAQWYKETYLELNNESLEPLIHYVKYGRKNNLATNKRMQS